MASPLNRRLGWIVGALIGLAIFGFALGVVATSSATDDEMVVGVTMITWLIVPVTMMIALWMGMLWDMCVTPADVWRAAGHDRLFCVFLMFLLGPVGAVLYGLAVRPNLARAELKKAAWQAQQRRRHEVTPKAA